MEVPEQTTKQRDPWYDIFTPREAEVSSECAEHPGRLAQGLCSMCGVPICIECRHTIAHRPLCPKCAFEGAVPPADGHADEANAAPAQASVEQSSSEQPQPPEPGFDGFIIRFSGAHRKAA